MILSWCLYLVAILASVHFGACIECYSCSTKDNIGCKRLNSVQKRHCDTPGLNITKYLAQGLEPNFSEVFAVDNLHDPLQALNCLKLIVKVANEEHTLRGCQLPTTNKKDVCWKLKNKHKDSIEIIHCSLCNTDGCNLASLNYLTKFTFYIALLPLLFKL